MTRLCLVVMAAALLFSSGCWPRKKKVAPPPPAPAPQAQPAPREQPEPSPPPGPAPVPQAQPPETPPPARPAHPHATHPGTPRPQPAPPAAAPTPEPVPQLGEMIPAGQRRQLDASYGSDLRKARDVLATVGAAKLDATRAEMATRVRSFIRQAEEYHDRDLVAAAELARRARLLAEDLAARLK